MTRGEIWAGFVEAFLEGTSNKYDLSNNTATNCGIVADRVMAEYDKRFDADGNEKQQEGT